MPSREEPGDRRLPDGPVCQVGVVEPWETSLEGKTVVVGLGNPYMRDDGVGIVAARTLRARGLGEDVFVYETQEMELSLLWQLRTARKVVILDALISGRAAGTVTTHAIAPGENIIARLPSLHALQLYDLFDVAEEGGLLSCPVVIIGAEPKDCGVGEGLTDELAAAVHVMVDALVQELD